MASLLNRAKTYLTPLIGKNKQKHSPKSPSPTDYGEAQVHVRVVECAGLKSLDANGFSDPYIKLKYGRRKEKTATMPKTLDPVFNKDFTFTLPTDGEGDEIRVEVMDEDPYSANEFLGVCNISLADLKEHGSLVGWQHLTSADFVGPSRGRIYLICVWDKDRSKQFKQFEHDSNFLEIRSSLLQHAQDEYESQELKLERESISVFVGTWNVGNALPPDPQEFTPWLKPGYDIYAIGVQECQYDPPTRLQSCASDWDRRLNDYFDKNDYIFVHHHSLLEIRLHVFVRRDSLFRIGRIHSNAEATGLAHVVGNKGGVCISFSYDNVDIALITSHLAAHQSSCKRRNADVAEIIAGIHLNQYKLDILHQFHHIIWSGDLNYRIDFTDQGDQPTPTPEQFQQFIDKIEKGGLKQLYSYDQLLRERENQRVFTGFNEGECYHFRPTFKVERQSKVEVYKNQRSPAYCDRVLWKSVDGYPIRQTEYNSAPALDTSDHKPVYAAFQIDLPYLPPAVDNRFGKASLVFDELSVKDLRPIDMNGLADPFVTFIAPFLKEPISITHHQKTLACKWTSDMIPRLDLLINNPNRMSHAYLVISVQDYNAVQNTRALGRCRIRLDSLMSGSPVRIQEQLTHGGLPAGTLTASVTLIREKSTFVPIPKDKL